MYFRSILLISFLSISPILEITIAHPLGVAAGITSSSAGRLGNGQRGRRPGSRCRTRRECASSEDTFHFSSSESSSSIPDSWIFHGPDGDAESTCPNPLPVNVLYAVQKGHGCMKMAEIYNDVNGSPDFNCKKASGQKGSLCKEERRYGALAQSCYDFLLQSDPQAAEDIQFYRGICNQS